MPVAPVVARPQRRPAAGTGGRAARKHEWTLVRSSRAEAFPGRLGHARRILVVVCPVIPLAMLEAHVIDLGSASAGVVHVDPRAAEAPVAELACVAGPP